MHSTWGTWPVTKQEHPQPFLGASCFTGLKMHHKCIILSVTLLSLISGCIETGKPVSDVNDIRQQMSAIERGRYVTVVMGCNDCHTPDYLVRRANIPEENWLVGSSLGFRSALGTSYPTNLRLLLSSIDEEEWLVIAKQMRRESPMADVMLPETEDRDLRAIYQFIKYLGPKGGPAPTRLPQGVLPSTPYLEVPAPH